MFCDVLLELELELELFLLNEAVKMEEVPFPNNHCYFVSSLVGIEH